MNTTLTIRTDSAIGNISPRLYGHFAEHLGRCCYDGLWVGRDSHIPNQDGFRSDVIEALRAMPTPLLRWPGGCYADHYHWRDGIGENRQVRLGMSCGLQVRDDNGLGTHEFMRLCELIGAEPYLAGNVGSGSVQELCDWLEYCNSAVPTTLAQERAANGSPKPFGVKLWGVGNENWGCGGHYDAVTYAHEYKRYATMLRQVDANAELVACGFEYEWNEKLLATLARNLNLVDHLSIHRYWVNGGPEIDFSDEQYYALLAEAEATEKFIQETAQIIHDASGSESRIKLALDEWGVWHPEEREWGPRTATQRTPTTYEQAGTLRDALAAGIAFEIFHRNCNMLSMANLAQIVNVLHAPIQTQGEAMWLTPTYYAFQLHKPHIGAAALQMEYDANDSLPDGSSAVSATASRSENSVQATIINRHLYQAAVVKIFRSDAGENVHAKLLTADKPNATNSAAFPERVKPVALNVERDSGAWIVEMPPHSLATVEWKQ
jgi:alpha-N-arabinofuranosidase